MEKISVDIPTIDLSKTLCSEYIRGFKHPWEIFVGLSNYIYSKGPGLPYDSFDEISDGIWVHTSAYMSPTAKIEAPAIICGGAKICHGAHVKGSVIGGHVTVGDNSYICNSILFDLARVDSGCSITSALLAHSTVLGSNTVITNSHPDRSPVAVTMPNGTYLYGVSGPGAIIGEYARVGANCVLTPGAVIDEHASVYPLCRVEGYVGAYEVVR